MTDDLIGDILRRLRDLTDELFDEVIQCDKAGGAAVLIDDDGEVDASVLHELEQRRRGHDFRHGQDLTIDLLQRQLARETALQKVFHMDKADDLVSVFDADRIAGVMAFRQHAPHRFGQILIKVEDDDLISGDHDIARHEVEEIK